MIRKLLIAGLLGAPAILGLALTSSASAQSGGGCQLQGSANFSPGLTNTSQNFTYSFAGNLSGCQSNIAGAPTSGTVQAGKTLTEQVTNTITGATDTVTYQEPVPTGTGSCASSTTNGTAIVFWADGTTTVVGYSTTGAAAAVHLNGSVSSSVTLTATNAQPGDPTTFTINTTRYAGYSATGALTFQPPDPTACGGAGVTTAGISGLVTLSQ